MPIIYGLVAQNAVVLAEHATKTGNFPVIAQHILDKISDENKMTFVYDRYLFHILVKENLVFLCLADDTFGRRIPFAFLNDISNRFTDQYGTPEEAPVAFGFNEFAKVLAAQMHFFNERPESDRFRKVHEDLDQVKDVMIQNIDKVLERGERIELLVDKTEMLTQSSFAFRTRSTALRQKMWWQDVKLIALLSIAALVMLTVLSVYYFKSI